ncbi:hypothetical protein GCM10023219_19700 [Stakelama sediminis]
MDMRVVGVPVIDRYPFKSCVQIACHVLHHLAGEGAQVRHLAGILRRDDKAKVMPILLAAIGEDIAIGLVRAGIEHLAVRSITGDTVAFKIGDVARERCGTKRCAPMPDNAGFDNDAPLEGTAAALESSALAAPEMSGAAARSSATERRIACPARNLEHAADQRVGLAVGASTDVARAARPDVEVVVSHVR